MLLLLASAGPASCSAKRTCVAARTSTPPHAMRTHLEPPTLEHYLSSSGSGVLRRVLARVCGFVACCPASHRRRHAGSLAASMPGLE